MMEEVFSQLAPDYRPIVRRLLSMPLVPLNELEREVSDYLIELEKSSSFNEFLDIRMAQTLTDDCLDLIRLVSNRYSPKHHRILQVAVRYFVLDDDVEGDATSIIGFDDDAEVLQIAKTYLTRARP